MLDSDQERIRGIYGERALVLAGPGCGKTYILATRVFEANAGHGVDFGDMLCLTFTNRAAREMNERISGLMGYVPPELFVGNIHRFCLRFLLANNLLAPETGILDEDDQNEYFLEEFGIRNNTEAANLRKATMRVFQDEHDFPEDLKQRLRFNLSESVRTSVHAYMDYKRAHGLVDYDEIILRAYDALSVRDGDMLQMSAYSWIQVDEVQDMTPIQLAIVRLLSDHAGARSTCLYLGDEQQAIFSFIGAGGPALERLKHECHGRVYHLKRNYRSPRWLVELCNELARTWLDLDEEFLPTTAGELTEGGEVRLQRVPAPDLEAAHAVLRFTTLHPHESVSVLVNTNMQAESVSEALKLVGIEHIKLSRNDMFHQAAFKTLYSHLAVVRNAFCVSDWARLLYQSGVSKSLRAARRFCKGLLDVGVCPSEMLEGESSTKVERFCKLMSPAEEKTVVVLDTETTGLDVFEDDVVEIAAVKIRGGKIVEGSEFDIMMRTERPLPRTLGTGEDNPLLKVYNPEKAVEAEEGLRLFGEYLKDADAVAGHNLDFDLPILRFNYRRRSGSGEIPRALLDGAPCMDTLWISRLLMQGRHSYRLGVLAGIFGIDTGTAHLAIDDARATARLACMLLPMAMIKTVQIRETMADARVMRTAARFDEVYGHHYRRARALMEDAQTGAGNSLVAEMTWLYDDFENRGLIGSIEHYDYLVRLVDEVIVDYSTEPRFREQLSRRLPELRSFNEGDLFTNGIVKENVSVMTVHKAKGLEMDNVVFYNADTGFGSVMERAKVFYVAFSRARKRLLVHYTHNLDPIVGAIRNKF